MHVNQGSSANMSLAVVLATPILYIHYSDFRALCSGRAKSKTIQVHPWCSSTFNTSINPPFFCHVLVFLIFPVSSKMIFLLKGCLSVVCDG